MFISENGESSSNDENDKHTFKNELMKEIKIEIDTKPDTSVRDEPD